MQEDIKQYFEDNLEKIKAFYKDEGIGLDESDSRSGEDGFGEFVIYLVKKVFGIKAGWDEVASVDMGPAGNIDTYMLVWVAGKKVSKVLFTYDLDGEYSLAD